jgi:cell division protein FtsN
VDAIKFKLDKGEAYDLTLVGKFTRDDNNRIHFQKDQNWVIDPELFGLGSLELLELDAEETPISDVSTKETPMEKKQVQSEKVKAKKKLHTPKKPKEKSDQKPVNKWKIIWIVIGSLIAVLVLILLIPSGDEGSAIEFGKDGIVIRNTDTKKAPSKPKYQQDIKGQAEEVIVDDKEAEKGFVPVDVPVPENQYFIIAGSFQNIQNATELLEQLKVKGYPAEIIYTENRMYRVSVKSFSTKESAVNNLSSIKATPGLEKVWVWQK